CPCAAVSPLVEGAQPCVEGLAVHAVAGGEDAGGAARKRFDGGLAVQAGEGGAEGLPGQEHEGRQRGGGEEGGQVEGDAGAEGGGDRLAVAVGQVGDAALGLTRRPGRVGGFQVAAEGGRVGGGQAGVGLDAGGHGGPVERGGWWPGGCRPGGRRPRRASRSSSTRAVPPAPAGARTQGRPPPGGGPPARPGSGRPAAPLSADAIPVGGGPAGGG